VALGLLLGWLLVPSGASAHDASVQAVPSRFTVVAVDLSRDDLQLYWADEMGLPFRSFDRLSGWLRKQGRQLVFGMNAGMYEPDGSPVGLLVLSGKEVSPLNLNSGYGNFFLKPNGVFFWSRSGPRVVDSTEYPKLSGEVMFATQSGPLLVKDGAVHPKLNPASTSRHIRNGVGVTGQMAYFVISEEPVTFYELATFFRDELKCRDALYFDGSVSSLYSARDGRHDRRAQFGPLVGIAR
jgi:uncharacterized protein YigE (DUF2233 family)